MMRDWNVVVSVHEQQYKHAQQLLEELGLVSPTDFYNVYAVNAKGTILPLGTSLLLRQSVVLHEKWFQRGDVNGKDSEKIDGTKETEIT